MNKIGLVIAMCAVAALALLLDAQWNDRESDPVTIVLPTNWKPGVRYFMILDSVHGVDPERKEGQWVYHYSESGIRYKTFAPLRHWHKDAMVTEDGRTIYASGSGYPSGLLIEQSNKAASRQLGPNTWGGTGDEDGAEMDVVLRTRN